MRRAWPEPGKADAADDEEWLYRLERVQQGSVHHAANAALEKAQEGDAAGAAEAAAQALATCDADELVTRAALEYVVATASTAPVL